MKQIDNIQRIKRKIKDHLLEDNENIMKQNIKEDDHKEVDKKEEIIQHHKKIKRIGNYRDTEIYLLLMYILYEKCSSKSTKILNRNYNKTSEKYEK